MILTPAHQQPTGAVLSGERRAALLAWLRDGGAFAIEDDYDAEYRYDRAAVGALQGLVPTGRVRRLRQQDARARSAPRLARVPPALLDAVTDEKLWPTGARRIEEYAFADFVARGELDRHLRRMRTRYRGGATRSSGTRRSASRGDDPRDRRRAHATVELPGTTTSMRSATKPHAAAST